MAKTKKTFGQLPLREQQQLIYAHAHEIARLKKSIAAKKEAIKSAQTENGLAA